MNPRDVIWSKFVIGEALDRDEEKELESALSEDVTFRAGALADGEIDGLLRTMVDDVDLQRHFSSEFPDLPAPTLPAPIDAALLVRRRLAARGARRAPRTFARPALWLSLGAAVGASLAVVVMVQRNGRDERADRAEIATRQLPRFVTDPAPARLAWVIEGSGTVDGRPLEIDQELKPGVRVTTTGEALKLGFDGATVLTLQAEGDLTLGEASALDHEIVLSRGSLHAEVAPQRPLHALVFLTPQARVSVVGTKFLLTVKERATKIVVEEGLVQFENLRKKTSVRVAAGQQALAVDDDGTARERPPDAGGHPLGQGFLFDFEDGVAPTALAQGQIVPAPGPSGSKFCVIAELISGSAQGVAVQKYPRPLFRYTERSVVTFDYWVGSGVGEIIVQVFDDTQKQNHFTHLLRLPIHNGWGHALVRLAGLSPRGRPDRRLAEGDAISNINIMIMAGLAAGSVLYIDNIQYSDWPPEAPLPKTSASSPASP